MFGEKEEAPVPDEVIQPSALAALKQICLTGRNELRVFEQSLEVIEEIEKLQSSVKSLENRKYRLTEECEKIDAVAEDAAAEVKKAQELIDRLTAEAKASADEIVAKATAEAEHIITQAKGCADAAMAQAEEATKLVAEKEATAKEWDEKIATAQATLEEIRAKAQSL